MIGILILEVEIVGLEEKVVIDLFYIIFVMKVGQGNIL